MALALFKFRFLRFMSATEFPFEAAGAPLPLSALPKLLGAFLAWLSRLIVSWLLEV